MGSQGPPGVPGLEGEPGSIGPEGMNVYHVDLHQYSDSGHSIYFVALTLFTESAMRLQCILKSL